MMGDIRRVRRYKDGGKLMTKDGERKKIMRNKKRLKVQRVIRFFWIRKVVTRKMRFMKKMRMKRKKGSDLNDI